MDVNEIMQALEENGSEQTKKVWIRHGAKEPFFGVKVAFLKTIVRKVKKNYELSKRLYETGNSDAMYLAGLISEPQKMTREELQHWAKKAYWYMLSDYTVAWVTSESKYALELAVQWIENGHEFIASAGWSTLSSYLSITPNDQLKLDFFRNYLVHIPRSIDSAPNRVKYAMNGFIIAVGSYVPDLTKEAKKVATQVGKVSVFMGNTSCKVPLASDYIQKVEDVGKIGKKRKTAIC